MEKVIGEYLSGITLGEPQVFKNFGVVPLFHTANGGPLQLRRLRRGDVREGQAG